MIRFAKKIKRGVGKKEIFHSEGGGGVRQKVTLHDMGGSDGQAKNNFFGTLGVRKSKKMSCLQRVVSLFLYYFKGCFEPKRLCFKGCEA